MDEEIDELLYQKLDQAVQDARGTLENQRDFSHGRADTFAQLDALTIQLEIEQQRLEALVASNAARSSGPLDAALQQELEEAQERQQARAQRLAVVNAQLPELQERRARYSEELARLQEQEERATAANAERLDMYAKVLGLRLSLRRTRTHKHVLVLEFLDLDTTAYIAVDDERRPLFIQVNDRVVKIKHGELTQAIVLARSLASGESLPETISHAAS